MRVVQAQTLRRRALLSLSNKPMVSNARFKQHKFSMRPRKYAHCLCGIRSREFASLKPCRKLTFTLLSLAPPMKCLYVAHTDVLETCTYDIPHLARIIMLETHVGRVRCLTRANKRVSYVPNAVLQTHASRCVARLNDGRPKTRARKRVVQFDYSELIAHVN